MDYEQYKIDIAADVAKVISEKGCQPILFVGSGFSKRYANAPNWEELLTSLEKNCPDIKRSVAYHRQSGLTMPAIGSIFAEAYKEWAWSSGKDKFPSEYFDAGFSPDIFLKYTVTQMLKHLGPNSKGSYGGAMLNAEIAALKLINPHAVITTNYDQLLEPIFNEYVPIIGQQVIRHAYMSIGEIFKIHGCVSDPTSLTLIEKDYEKFANDKKYLSAKLFTYFVEHPLVFIGYSAGDQNIQNILEEIDHMLPEDIGLIDNIYIIEWQSEIKDKEYPQHEKLISLGNGRSIRIKSIATNTFEWVFKAFRSDAPLEKINVKLLRSILHRTVNLIRKDGAKNTVELDFAMLDSALESPGTFAKVFGVAAMADPALLNIMYPLSPTAVAKKLGFKNWSAADHLVGKLKVVSGFDMRASDNRFHICIPSGVAGKIRKYSQAGLDLLMKFKRGDVLPDLTDANVIGELTKPPVES